MTDALNTWIAGYRRAWESNDPAQIRALFTEDARYRTEPYAVAWSGHDEIVAGWLEARDEPGDASFDWFPLVDTAELCVVQGETRYRNGDGNYSNLWVIRLGTDGRASEFTEWWMKHPDD